MGNIQISRGPMAGALCLLTAALGLFILLGTGGQAENAQPWVDLTSHEQGTTIEERTTLGGTFYDPDIVPQLFKVEYSVNGSAWANVTDLDITNESWSHQFNGSALRGPQVVEIRAFDGQNHSNVAQLLLNIITDMDPVANFTWCAMDSGGNCTTGPASLGQPVLVNASGSYDNSGTIVDYGWTLDPTSSSVNPYAVVADNSVLRIFFYRHVVGGYNLTLTVVDAHGNTGNVTLPIPLKRVVDVIAVSLVKHSPGLVYEGKDVTLRVTLGLMNKELPAPIQVAIYTSPDDPNSAISNRTITSADLKLDPGKLDGTFEYDVVWKKLKKGQYNLWLVVDTTDTVEEVEALDYNNLQTMYLTVKERTTEEDDDRLEKIFFGLAAGLFLAFTVLLAMRLRKDHMEGHHTTVAPGYYDEEEQYPDDDKEDNPEIEDEQNEDILGEDEEQSAEDEESGFSPKDTALKEDFEQIASEQEATEKESQPSP